MKQKTAKCTAPLKLDHKSNFKGDFLWLNMMKDSNRK